MGDNTERCNERFSMNVKDVDVGDEVQIMRGDWAGQRGVVQTKCELMPDPSGLLRALLTIRLTGDFQRTIQKNNLDIEKIAS